MPDRPPEIVLSRPTLDAAGLAALGVRWRRLEPSVEASPFQTWTWVGTIAAQYADPLLIEAKDSTGLVAIALLNRRRTMLGDVLYLHETGDPARDAVFIERNGPLTAPSQDALCTRMLRAA
ncbi:MAG: hypothetical protein H7Z10_07335, partial [Gemmatimonadaceae bacterium]|nr:hypothetical protein [Acetobacteraceae bacterium]